MPKFNYFSSENDPPQLIIKFEIIDPDLSLLEKSRPMKAGEKHQSNPWVARFHPSRQLMWHANNEQAAYIDKTINDPALVGNFLNKIPESHRPTMENAIRSIQKDPNRHFIPSQEKGRQVLRARHLKGLLLDADHVKVDTSDPNVLNIQRVSHSTEQDVGPINITYRKAPNGIQKNEHAVCIRTYVYKSRLGKTEWGGDRETESSGLNTRGVYLCSTSLQPDRAAPKRTNSRASNETPQNNWLEKANDEKPIYSNRFEIEEPMWEIAKSENYKPFKDRLINTPHIIFSAENALHPAKTKSTHSEVLSHLKSTGEDAHPMMGKYGEEEPSIVVFSPKDPDHIKGIAKDLGQESLIESDGVNHKMHFLNGPDAGKVKSGAGTLFHSIKPNDYYSVLPDGTTFTHNIGNDFNIKKFETLFKNYEKGVKINPEHGKIIANAYQNMKHDPNHPQVKAAYNALIGETKKQFKDIMSSGLKISKIKEGQENPYKSSKDLHNDVINNNHMWYFPTESGFGSEESHHLDHPMLQPTELTHEGKPMLANDVFRIAHDMIHVKGKSGFGPKGEHQAYLDHKKTFSPLASKALATETMGQNNFVNFGKYGESNRKNPEKTIYAEQKAGLLPDSIINTDWHKNEA